MNNPQGFDEAKEKAAKKFIQRLPSLYGYEKDSIGANQAMNIGGYSFRNGYDTGYEAGYLQGLKEAAHLPEDYGKKVTKSRFSEEDKAYLKGFMDRDMLDLKVAEQQLYNEGDVLQILKHFGIVIPKLPTNLSNPSEL